MYWCIPIALEAGLPDEGRWLGRQVSPWPLFPAFQNVTVSSSQDQVLLGGLDPPVPMLMLIPFICSFKVTVTYNGPRRILGSEEDRCSPSCHLPISWGWWIMNKMKEWGTVMLSKTTRCAGREGMKYQVIIGGRCLSLKFSPVCKLESAAWRDTSIVIDGLLFRK